MKSKNYDSPFDREESEYLGRQSLLDEEQLQNTEFVDEFTLPPDISFATIPSMPWMSQNPTSFFSDKDSDAYERYREIEGLE